MDEDWIAQLAAKGRRKKLRLLIGSLLLFTALTATGAFIWIQRPATSLLPALIAQKTTTFTPYFYFDKIPAGYSLDTIHISFDDDVLIMPLKKAGSPPIILTEQAIADNLSQEEVQKNGEAISGTASPATINKVEGRLVGTMFASDHKTLILLTTATNTNEDDLMALLRELKPLRED